MRCWAQGAALCARGKCWAIRLERKQRGVGKVLPEEERTRHKGLCFTTDSVLEFAQQKGQKEPTVSYGTW